MDRANLSRRNGHETWIVGDPKDASAPALVFTLGVPDTRRIKPVYEHAPIPWGEIARIATGDVTLEQLKEAAK